MTFSVLMSVYDKENPKYFDLALESNLINQTTVPTEMILVCDGQLNQELDDVINKYEKIFPDVLKVHRLKKNVGLGQALNIGLEKCSCEWIARSDSDDICAPNRFEKQLEYAISFNVDIVGSDIDEFDEDWSKPIRVKRMPCLHDEILKMAKSRNPINHMSVMFKKDKITDCGSYQHLPYAEDYYLWVRAINHGAIFANIDECLVHARVGNGMEKRRGNKAYISSWKKLNQYMLSNGMINKRQKIKNIIAVRTFVYLPNGMRKLIYKYILRN